MSLKPRKERGAQAWTAVDGSAVTAQLSAQTGKQSGREVAHRSPYRPSGSHSFWHSRPAGDSTFSEGPHVVQSGLDPQPPLPSALGDTILPLFPRRTSDLPISPAVGTKNSQPVTAFLQCIDGAWLLLPGLLPGPSSPTSQRSEVLHPGDSL